MKNKDKSHGGQTDQKGRSIGNQQTTTQTGGRNNAGQDPDNNKREGQGEGSQGNNQSRQRDGGNRGSRGSVARTNPGFIH